MYKILKSITFSFLLVAILTGYAFAGLYSFECITNNNLMDATIGEAQLFMNVEDANNAQVLFTFTNKGVDNCVITDIYFDDDMPMLQHNSFNYNGDVLYQTMQINGNQNLPGAGGNGNNVSFSADYGDSPKKQGGVHNGIDQNESLEILFDLIEYEQNLFYTFGDIITALNNGSIKVGLHVQTFDGDGSESFINNNPVAEPATLFLLGAGLIGVAGFSRKKLFKTKK